MASNYSFIHNSDSLPLKSNSSSQLYGATTSSSRNMGVLVTAPWPMSQQISPQIYSSIKGSRDSNRVSKECNGSDQHWTHRHGASMRHHSHSHLRPVSMPPTYATVRPRESPCYHENAIEMVPLNPNVPYRTSIPMDLNPTSPPTCVPWLKKMKKRSVMKKIRRKFGIGLCFRFEFIFPHTSFSFHFSSY
jgi:hypothetical protein